MSHLTNIMRKELREMLTPGSVISVLIMVVLFASLGTMIGSEVEKAAELPKIGYVGASEGQYLEWNAYDQLVAMYGESAAEKIIVMDSSYGDIQSITDEMRSKGISAVIGVPDDIYEQLEAHKQVAIAQYYIYEPVGMFGSTPSAVVGSVVTLLNSSLSKVLIGQDPSADYDFVINPLYTGTGQISTVVNGSAYQGITPYDIANELTSKTMMIPMVIMVVIMMVGSIVISSMGSEKENKTLETLLTLPIKRTTIVSGKILASAVVGLVYGLAYMAGMSIYMNGLTGRIQTGKVDLEAIGMSLDMSDWILIMLSMFLAIVCALGICMILGAFAKNYKSAQTMTMPLSILAMIPMFVIMFSGWYGSAPIIKAVTFAIPFSHPMMAMQALMNGDVALVLSGIVYMALFAAVMIAITVWLYRSDILITGLGQSKLVQKLSVKRR